MTQSTRGLFATAELYLIYYDAYVAGVLHLVFIARQHTDARYCLSVRCVPVFYGNGLTYCHCVLTTR